MLTADDPQFADADSIKQRDKYMAYLGEAARAKKQAVREPTLRPTEGDLATVLFMGKRIEEANLLYVAITRAKVGLFMVHGDADE